MHSLDLSKLTDTRTKILFINIASKLESGIYMSVVLNQFIVSHFVSFHTTEDQIISKYVLSLQILV